MDQDSREFGQIVGELDAHLFQKGLHYKLYDLLGATMKEHKGVLGTHFAVWAPNAVSIFLKGDFNNWNNESHPMRPVGQTGVWELFLPNVKEGDKYLYEVVTKKGERKIKADPVGHFFEMRPHHCSIVFDVNRFSWSDEQWLKERGSRQNLKAPIHIYEVHLGSWKRKNGGFLSYRELVSQLISYCKQMHFTHVELMGILAHPLDESWGYQVSGYFAPTCRFGTPEDFQFFVNELHNNGIGVILDWVPGHFPIDEHSLAEFDGTYLYEHKDPRQGFHPQWSTHIFNYGRYEVSNFLLASALFWLEKMHIDGLRVDAVSSMLYLDYGRKEGEWIPNRLGTNINLEALEFLKHLNSIVHKTHPDVLMMAEEASAFPGVTRAVEEEGLGFDLKWNLGWMNDTLGFLSREFQDRSSHIHDLTFVYDYAFKERYILPLSHDEVVHEKRSLYSKMPGSDEKKRAGMRLLLSLLMCTPGKKLLFMGGEFGQKTEWNCKEELPWNLLSDPEHAKLQNMVAALGALYAENGTLAPSDHEQKSFSFLFLDEINGVIVTQRNQLVCIHHVLEKPLHNFALPLEGKYREIFSTDREEWGGSGILNGEVEGGIVHLPLLSSLIFEKC